MKARSNSVRRALLAGSVAALIAIPTQFSAAAPAQSAKARLTKDNREWVLNGEVKMTGAGQLKGELLLVHHVPGHRPTICHWTRFGNASFTPDQAVFEALGTCHGDNEHGPFEFAAHNTISLVDGGKPGPGLDTVDINYLGGSGIAVPGGFIEWGEVSVQG